MTKSLSIVPRWLSIERKPTLTEDDADKNKIIIILKKQ